MLVYSNKKEIFIQMASNDLSKWPYTAKYPQASPYYTLFWAYLSLDIEYPVARRIGIFEKLLPKNAKLLYEIKRQGTHQWE